MTSTPAGHIPETALRSTTPMTAASASDGRSSGIRLLASTGSLLLSPLDWVLETIGEAGFDGAELVVGHNPESRDPDRLRALADATGVGLAAVHGPYMLLLRGVLGMGYAEKTHRTMQLAAAVGAEIVVAHAPFRFERGAGRWLATRAADELAGYGPRFAMENLYPVGGRNFSLAVTPEDMLAFEHVVFDTSHYAVAGVDLFAAWELLSDRVVHLHVSDNTGGGRDSHAPIGSGTLPLAAFLRHVAASGWSGTATLELDVRAYLENRTTLVRFLRGQCDLARRLLTDGDIGDSGRVDDAGSPSTAGVS